MSFTNKILTSNHVFTFPSEEVILSSEIPLRGWAKLTNVLIVKEDSTATRDIKIQFRTTTNAIQYNDWEDIEDLQEINIGIREDFLIEFKAVRIGADLENTVKLVSITIEGDYQQSYFDVFDFMNDTIFSEIKYDDYQWNKLWINLLKKLYKRGIVPEYIERGETAVDEDGLNDTDYIAFWKVVAYFYALLSELSRRKVDGLREDAQYLIEHLEQKGLFLCRQCLDCSADHIYIMENIFDEFRQRGTLNIALKKSADKRVNGEMLRMICYDPTDEFLFEYLPRHLSGWNVNNTSPLYRGKTSHIQLNKAPEDTKDVLDLSKYTLIGSVETVEDGDKTVAILNQDSGISFPVIVDPYVSYELTFFVKFPASNSDSLTVKADAFDALISKNLQKISGFTTSNIILDSVAMPNNQVYYFVRCIVYSRGQNITGDDSKTSLNQGENLKMVDVDTNKLVFSIINDNAISMRIWDIKCKPLILSRSSVYINSYNVMNVFLNNRNASLTVIDFEENARRYLLPYGTIFQLFASPKSQFDPETLLVQNDNYEILTNDDGSILV